MKASEAHISSSAVHFQQRTNEPFFNKQGREGFFSKSGESKQSFFRPTIIQPKLTIGQPNDLYEQEADAMADKVVQRLLTSDVHSKKEIAVQAKPVAAGITSLIQAKCATCKQEEKLQKKEEVDEKDLLKNKLQTKPIFESDTPPDDEKIIQQKCQSCASEGSLNIGSTAPAIGSPKLENARRSIDNLEKKRFPCPPVSDSYANIGLKGEGTIGLTSIDKSSDLLCVPKFDVDTKAGQGTLKKVKVSLKMNSKFSKQETEAPLGLKLEVPGCKTEVPVFVNITKDISELAQIGEQEHCDDVNLAFKQTLLPCSSELNKFAGQKFAGKNFDECYKSLVAKIGFDPIDCSEEFVNLSNKTGERDDKGFHDFDFKPISQDCKKVVVEFKKAKTNKVGDKSVAPDKWIPSSTKCAKPQPVPPVAPTKAPTPTPKPEIKKKCAECNEEKDKKLQTKSGNSTEGTVAPSVENILSSSKGSGKPLHEDTRKQVEPFFGADFSNVRVHNDATSVQMSKDLNAQAFTHGSDIYFNSGKYDTSSTEGKHLLAHELTHVTQQNTGRIQRDDIPEGKTEPAEEKPPGAKPSIPLSVPIVLNWNFSLPAVPKIPDYSIDFDSLGALEIAKLVISKPSFIPIVESTDAKDNSSFLKELTVDFKPVLSYHIAKQLNELATIGETQNPIKGLPVPQGDTQTVIKCFRQLLSKIQIHAKQHFQRYDAVIATFQADFIKAVESIPSSKKPYSMKKAEMEAYVTEFMLYQVALLQRKLWQDVCAWEKEDYPKLLKNTCWGGRFQEDCGSAPQLPTPPAVLITGKRGK